MSERLTNDTIPQGDKYPLYEEIYSEELVSAFVKDMYHCKSSQFECSSAERTGWVLRATAIIFTRDADLAAQIVRRGQLNEDVRKYGTPMSLEMGNDNNGNFWRFTFGFWLDH